MPRILRTPCLLFKPRGPPTYCLSLALIRCGSARAMPIASGSSMLRKLGTADMPLTPVPNKSVWAILLATLPFPGMGIGRTIAAARPRSRGVVPMPPISRWTTSWAKSMPNNSDRLLMPRENGLSPNSPLMRPRMNAGPAVASPTGSPIGAIGASVVGSSRY